QGAQIAVPECVRERRRGDEGGEGNHRSTPREKTGKKPSAALLRWRCSKERRKPRSSCPNTCEPKRPTIPADAPNAGATPRSVKSPPPCTAPCTSKWSAVPAIATFPYVRDWRHPICASAFGWRASGTKPVLDEIRCAESLSEE